MSVHDGLWVPNISFLGKLFTLWITVIFHMSAHDGLWVLTYLSQKLITLWITVILHICQHTMGSGYQTYLSHVSLSSGYWAWVIFVKMGLETMERFPVCKCGHVDFLLVTVAYSTCCIVRLTGQKANSRSQMRYCRHLKQYVHMTKFIHICVIPE